MQMCKNRKIFKNRENSLHSEKKYVKVINAFVRWKLFGGSLDKKEVNESNEGRNPSQLSADYDYLRLR